MKPYKNLNGDSGVDKYEIGADYIKVKFKSGHLTYTYTNESASKAHIDKMKELAESGRGLNSYINLNVRNAYASKE